LEKHFSAQKSVFYLKDEPARLSDVTSQCLYYSKVVRFVFKQCYNDVLEQ